jgi:hypothetical protein
MKMANAGAVDRGPDRKIDIVPDVSMFCKMGQLNYKLDQAVGELVDNAVDASVKGRVEVKIDFGAKVIVVEDDGRGMTEKELESGLRLGVSFKGKNVQGGFGIGLKAAVTCLGADFVIQTARAQDESATEVSFDSEAFQAAGKWVLKVRTVEKTFVHGTRIEVSRLRVDHTPQSERRLKERLARIFKRFLKSGELSLWVNGQTVTAWEPSIDEKSRKSIVLKVRGHKVTGWVAQQLDRRKNSDGYGFDLIRRNRVISARDHVGLPNHAGIAGVFVGEIDLDSLPVTFQKNDFMRETPAWVEFEAQLTRFMDPLIRERRGLYQKPPKEPDIPKPFGEGPGRPPVAPKTPQRQDDSTPSEESDPKPELSSCIVSDLCSTLRPLVGDVEVCHEFKRMGVEHRFCTVARSSANGGTITIVTNLDAGPYIAHPLPDVWATVHVIEGVRSILAEIAGRGSKQNPVMDHLELSLTESVMASSKN